MTGPADPASGATPAAPSSAPRGFRVAAPVALLVLLSLGLVWRLRRFADVAALSLGPDATRVYESALTMRHLYDTGVREPLWPWLARVALWLDPAPTSLRWLSLTASVALIALGYRFGRDYTGRPLVGVGVAAVLAVHWPLIQICADAHRTELLALALLAVTYCVLVPGLAPARRWIGLTGSTAAALLTSLALVIPVAPLVAWAAWRHRIGWRALGLVAGITAALVTPHLVHNARTFGHPLHFHARLLGTFYRNHEFVRIRQTGCATCPTRAEMEAAGSGLIGPKVGLWEYVVGMHSAREVVKRLWDGYAQVFWRRGGLSGWYWHGLYAGPPDRGWDILYYTGVAWLLVGPYRLVAVVPLLGLNGLAFLIPLGVDQRLVMPLAPYAAFAVTLPAADLLERGLWR